MADVVKIGMERRISGYRVPRLYRHSDSTWMVPADPSQQTFHVLRAEHGVIAVRVERLSHSAESHAPWWCFSHYDDPVPAPPPPPKPAGFFRRIWIRLRQNRPTIPEARALPKETQT